MILYTFSATFDWCLINVYRIKKDVHKVLMMTSSNGSIFRVTGPLCGEFTGHRWIPPTKASHAELWCFLWSGPWINGWVNNHEAGDLRRHRAHYDVTIMYWKGVHKDVSSTFVLEDIIHGITCTNICPLCCDRLYSWDTDHPCVPNSAWSLLKISSCTTFWQVGRYSLIRILVSCLQIP